MEHTRLLGAATVVVLALGIGSTGLSGAAALPQHGYVTTSLQLPTTGEEAAKLGRDMDRDGTRDNALGMVFAAMTQASSGMLDHNAGLADSIVSGRTLMTHSLRTASLRRTNDATWQVWYAAPTTEPPDLSDGAFTLPRTQPHSKRLPATISRHKVTTAAGALPVQLDLGAGAFTLWLTQAKIRATCYASSCRVGRISGALPATEVDQQLVPALHDAFSAVILRDCPSGTESCAADSQGQTLLGVFDENSDGTLTEAELRENSLLTTLLHPDLDLRKADGSPGKDGVMDAMSFGVAFEAARATLVRSG